MVNYYLLNDEEFEQLLNPIEIIITFYNDENKLRKPNLKKISNLLHNDFPDSIFEHYKNDCINDSVIFPLEFSVLKNIMEHKDSYKTFTRKLNRTMSYTRGVTMRYKYMGLSSRYANVMKYIIKQVYEFQIEHDFGGFNITIGRTISDKIQKI